MGECRSASVLATGVEDLMDSLRGLGRKLTERWRVASNLDRLTMVAVALVAVTMLFTVLDEQVFRRLR
jgi:hypothetical protein